MSTIIIIGGGGGGGQEQQRTLAQTDDGETVITGPDGGTVATFNSVEAAAKFLAHLANHPVG